jgi:hypothetical protein
VIRPAALLGVALIGLVLPASGAIAATPPSAEAAPTLRLVDQTFVVAGVNPTLTITLSGTALGPVPCDAPGSVIRVSAYRPTTRAGTRAPVSEQGDAVSRVNLDLCSLSRTASGGVRVDVPVTVTAPIDPTVQALYLPTAGVIPLGVEVRTATSSVERILTFIDRLPDGADATTPVADAMQVAVAVQVDGGPTHQPDGSIQVGSADRSQAQALLDLLQAVPQAPLTVALRPELIDGLASSSAAGDNELVTGLAAALDGDELLSAPYVSLDPTSAVRASLGDQFTDQVTRGEDLLFADLGVRPLRNAWLVGQPLGTDGAQLLRDLGVQLGVLLPDVKPIALIQPTRQFLVGLDRGTMAATQVDPDIAADLAEPGDDPTLTAYRLAAEILSIRAEALAGGAATIGDHNLIVTTPDATLGDPVVMTTLLGLLTSTPGLSMVKVSAISNVARPAVVDGSPLQVTLPDVEVDDLRPLAADLYAASGLIDAVSSMLPTGDARPASWRGLAAVSMSSALDASQRAAYFASVQADADAIRASVVAPNSNKFTLGGRHSTIRLTLRNDGATDLTVRLLVSSDKLTIEEPDSDQLVPLAAGQSVDVPVPVEALTNGEFPVDIEVVTPSNTDVQVTEPVQITARANALTGLGQLATGAFVLVLVTWWVQHFRSRRRRAAAAPAAATAA